jgi:hypothetical protein
VSGRGAVEAHEGGVADRFGDVVVDFCHDGCRVEGGKLSRLTG